MCGFLAFSVFVAKLERPISWQFYVASPLFLNREVIDHPIYGKMIVDKRINTFFSKVCNKVKSPFGKEELLSLPYSYANYYCGVQSWGNYVQTWYDTSSPNTIRGLIRSLQSRPPEWILYQRQPRILRVHEVFYNHGERLVHRDLDDVIMVELERGAWSVRTSWREVQGDDWVLIRTAPANGEAGRECSAAIVAHLKAEPDRDDTAPEPADTHDWDRDCA